MKQISARSVRQALRILGQCLSVVSRAAHIEVSQYERANRLRYNDMKEAPAGVCSLCVLNVASERR